MHDPTGRPMGTKYQCAAFHLHQSCRESSGYCEMYFGVSSVVLNWRISWVMELPAEAERESESESEKMQYLKNNFK